MRRNFFPALLVFISIVLMSVSSCKKEKMELDEEELITTVHLTFFETGTGNTSVVTFRDTDGEGGNPPSEFDDIVLNANKTYTCAISVLNESVNPADDVTAEIMNESENHQFYFIVTGVPVTVTTLDTDMDGLPLGLLTRWVTTSAGSGIARVVLKHKPGIKSAGDDVSKGETDIELVFNLTVQ
ncbi:MAG TPA: hypothetical protein VIK74_03230 [Parasegetibacter sp.]